MVQKESIVLSQTFVEHPDSRENKATLVLFRHYCHGCPNDFHQHDEIADAGWQKEHLPFVASFYHE
jgi:hypothetical protein